MGMAAGRQGFAACSACRGCSDHDGDERTLTGGTAKKKEPQKAAKEKNQVKYITRKVGGQNEELPRESESYSLPRH